MNPLFSGPTARRTGKNKEKTLKISNDGGQWRPKLGALELAFYILLSKHWNCMLLNSLTGKGLQVPKKAAGLQVSAHAQAVEIKKQDL